MVQPQVKFDRSLLGKEITSGPFQVTKDLILDFCRALGERNPLCTDEAEARRQGHPTVMAPPTICNLLIRLGPRPDIRIEFGKMQMHAGQAIEPLQPIYAGDVLTAKSKLKEVYTKTGRTGTMAFVVWEMAFFNQRGELVTVVRESFMRR